MQSLSKSQLGFISNGVGGLDIAGNVVGVTARYWRLSVTANQTGQNNNQMSVSELILSDTSGRILGGTPSARTNTFNAPTAFDADPTTTYFSSADPPHWLKYSYPAPVTLVSFGITASGAFQDPRVFVLEKSDDDINWETVFSPAPQTDWTAGETRSWDIT